MDLASTTGGTPAFLEDLLTEAGFAPHREIPYFVVLASAVQIERRGRGSVITRSTGLWTLMEMDEVIRTALEDRNLVKGDFGKVLSVEGLPDPIDANPAALEAVFADAVRVYLDGLVDSSVVGLPDIAIAILNSVRDSQRGILPKRLEGLGVDVDAAISALETLVAWRSRPTDKGVEESNQDMGETSTASSAPTIDANPVGYSASVRAIGKELSGSEVSAFDVAGALADLHGEYAGHQLGTATLTLPENPQMRGWKIWLDAVANLYAASAVEDPAPQVIDGRLLLAGLGLLDTELRRSLETARVWGPLLLEVDEAAVKGSLLLQEAVNAIQLAHGYRSDAAGGRDRLGIQGEVNALCDVIIDPDVVPPLAVGLFGAWGSGKSFFMEKMRERVSELTVGPDASREAIVVQIRFNAWHYADTSLWASLAVEIFERLFDPEPVDPAARRAWLRDHGDEHRKQREQLLGQLETYREAQAALEAERERLETERELLEDRRRELIRKRKDAVSNVALTDVIVGMSNDQTLKASLADLQEEIGFEPAIGELASVASELQTTSGHVSAVWRMVTHKTRVLILLATSLVSALLAVALVTISDWSWVGGLVTGLASIGATALAAARYLRPAAENVNTGLATIQTAIGRARETEARLRARRTVQERELEAVLAVCDQEITETTRSVAELTDNITKAQAEADTLTVGRRLYHFLADRASVYQQYQGVVGMLHRDFRLLDAKLRAQATGAERTDGDKNHHRIDRVILYIDDLDRCPPPKVLEVLEAVHLLLALELFIVVVGVDPRWLQRSLRHEYRTLVSSQDPGTDPYLQTMPTEYLEKIFQIPLTLPAMEPEGYGRLIASLAPKTAAPAPPTRRTPTVTRRAPTKESPGGDKAPTRAPLDVQPGSAASGVLGHPIDLTRDEIDFAQRLGGLIDTPRAAKRLMNTYRLIRVTQHVGPSSRFLGTDGVSGEYQAVLTLLAIAAGYPSMADRVLVALEENADGVVAPPATSQRRTWSRWPDFVHALKQGEDGAPDGALVPREFRNLQPDDTSTTTEAAEWANLLDGLERSLESNNLDDIETYQRWGPIVARFSFTL